MPRSWPVPTAIDENSHRHRKSRAPCWFEEAPLDQAKAPGVLPRNSIDWLPWPGTHRHRD